MFLVPTAILFGSCMLSGAVMYQVARKTVQMTQSNELFTQDGSQSTSNQSVAHLPPSPEQSLFTGWMASLSFGTYLAPRCSQLMMRSKHV